MNDERDFIDEPTPDEVSDLHRLLARPDVWDEPQAGVEDAVVAAIVSEARDSGSADPGSADSGSAGSGSTEPTAPITSLADRRAGRARPSLPWWLGAAAVAVLVVGGVALFGRGGDEADGGGVAVALSPTDAAVGASATARISATPAGVRIVLDVDDLPGAPVGSFYEAWIGNGEIRISAGTFHLRDGDDPIALWAGVADPAFDQLSITLEPLDGDPSSSGDVRFRGEFELPPAQPDD